MSPTKYLEAGIPVAQPSEGFSFCKVISSLSPMEDRHQQVSVGVAALPATAWERPRKRRKLTAKRTPILRVYPRVRANQVTALRHFYYLSAARSSVFLFK